MRELGKVVVKVVVPESNFRESGHSRAVAGGDEKISDHRPGLGAVDERYLQG